MAQRTRPTAAHRLNPPKSARHRNVESLEPRVFFSTFTVTNTADSGAGSLRQAIIDANNNAGADSISFNISGSGVHTISPTTQFPNITGAVTIDGYTQSGATANTNGIGSADNAVLKIVLDGSMTGAAATGLHLAGGNSTVRGLVFQNWPRNTVDPGS